MVTVGPEVCFELHVDDGARLLVHVRPGAAEMEPVVLLHGWGATSTLNWGRVLEPLHLARTTAYFDLRGHGEGPDPANGRFSLAECASDAARVISSLGQGPAIAVGYSMGGLISSLLALDHPGSVAGIVLVASGPSLAPGPVERTALRGLGLLAELSRRNPRISDIVEHSVDLHIDDRVVALGGSRDLRHRSVLPILDAGREIADADFAGRLSQITVPVGLLVTMEDRSVNPLDQLHTSWTGADVIIEIVEGRHDICLTNPHGLGVKLHGLIEDVAARAHSAERLNHRVEEELRKMSEKGRE
jgi:pimeloyl-ACP methyl ester carboxylesterase